MTRRASAPRGRPQRARTAAPVGRPLRERIAAFTWADGCAALFGVACAAQLAVLAVHVSRPAAATSPGVAPTAAGDRASLDLTGIAGLFGRRAESQAVDPAVADSLALVATLASADPKSGVAIVSSAPGAQHVYRVGDAMPGGATLDGVWSDRVALLAAGTIRFLAFPRSAFGSGALGGLAVTADAAPADEPRAENPRFLATVVRDGDEVRGIRVEPAGDPAGFARLKLQSGDVITTIDGKAVTRVREFEAAVAALGQYRQPVEVAVRRNGSPVMVYVLPDPAAANVDTSVAQVLESRGSARSAR